MEIVKRSMRRQYHTNAARLHVPPWKIDLAEGRYREAVSALTRLRNQEPVYVSESLQSLIPAYSKAGLPTGELCKNLECRLEITHSIAILRALVTPKRDQIGYEAIAKDIVNYFKRYPTMRGPYSAD